MSELAEITVSRRGAGTGLATLVRQDCPGPAGLGGTAGAGGTTRAAWSPAGGPGAVAPARVAVLARDPITAEGTASYLRSHPGVMPLAAGDLHEADVVLVLATWVTEETLTVLQRVAEQAAGRDVRFVLVGDGLREAQLIRAVSFGLMGVIPWQGSDHERIVRAILTVREGLLDMPDVALRWLIGQIISVRGLG